MAKQVELTLAGRNYTITELPARKNQKWRESLQAQFQDLVDILSQASKFELDSPEGMAQIGSLIQVLVRQAGGSVDVLRDRLIDYSPKLQADRDYLEENGYDSEFLDGFLEVLKLAYPFGRVIDLLTEKAGQLNQ